MHDASRLAVALGLMTLLVSGCADGAGGDAGVDSGSTGRDAAPREDAGETGCPSGQHDCGGGCIDDLPNEPDNGCRLGCGEACPAPPDGVATCSDAGTCVAGCEPPFELVDGACLCTPRTCADMGATCGAPDDGCGETLDCGACTGGGVCMDGSCACPLDAREPNDNRVQADTQPTVADIPDQNSWNMTFSEFGLHDGDDEDWLTFSIEDTGLDNPTIRVDLAAIPAGSNYDLAAYYVCDGGADASTCSSGATDNMLGRGCASSSSGSVSETVILEVECDRGTFGGTNDSGRLYVWIRSRAWDSACSTYELTVDIDS